MVHPTPNRLIGHRHSAFRQQIFDVAQAEGEPEVEPYRLVNDLRRETISAVADFLHPLGYSATGRTASPTPLDNASPIISSGACAQRHALRTRLPPRVRSWNIGSGRDDRGDLHRPAD